MKPVTCFLIFFLSIVIIAKAQVKLRDTIKVPDIVDVGCFDIELKKPYFSGGQKAFSIYLSKNLKYPKVAQLIGIKGKVIIEFTVNKKGKIIEPHALNCIGAGCESEAEKVFLKSPIWRPGTIHGVPVSVSYSLPISFIIENLSVKFKDLKASDYGFVFNIKDTLYTLYEAEKIIGKTFNSNRIKIAIPFFNYNKIEKFDMPDKKEVYLVIFKKDEAKKANYLQAINFQSLPKL